jgi:hypothetical protein
MSTPLGALPLDTDDCLKEAITSAAEQGDNKIVDFVKVHHLVSMPISQTIMSQHNQMMTDHQTGHHTP